MITITGLRQLPVVNDGYQEPTDARADCPICSGGGLLDDGDNYGACMVPCLCTGRASKDVVWKVWKHYPKHHGYIATLALSNITLGGFIMVQAAMTSMLKHLLEEAKKEGKLKDLLTTAVGATHPKISIGQKQFSVGLVDDKVMLIDGAGMLHDPEIAYNTLTAINWSL